eukprot:COSAG05_NODE_322_length_11414_cov_47.115510_10_plen_85_part_00
MTDIYLHIVARTADYMATHPYKGALHSLARSTRTAYTIHNAIHASRELRLRLKIIGNLETMHDSYLPTFFDNIITDYLQTHRIM